MLPGQGLAAFAHMTKVSGTATVVALVIVLGIAMPLHAQVCPPSSIKYAPRTSSGAILSAGDLEALRAQLPAIIGLDTGIDTTSTTPGLVFTNRYPCEADLRDVTLVHDGMRMHLWFDILLSPGHFLTIDGPPFQNADFVFDRSSISAEGLQSAPASSWKPIGEMGRTPGTTPLARDCPSTLQRDDPALLDIRVRRQSPSERRECVAYLVSAISDTGKPELRERAAKGIVAITPLIDDAAVLDPLIRCVAHYPDPAARYCNMALNGLTSHSYGYQFFNIPVGAPMPAGEPRRIVEDWRSYVSRPGGARHAIFDAFLRDQSLHAMQDVVNALRRAIGTALPGHPILPYLDQYAAHPQIQGSLWETIVDFNVSEAQSNSGFFPPYWRPGTPLQRVRVQLLRPGIPRPATADTSMDKVLRVSAAASTYREEFRNLDLEIRLQITTTDETLRADAVKEVRDALAALRAADRAAR
jgi:hypothetical protein